MPLQLRVVGRDQGTPQQTGTATVTVNVERNTYSPIFQNANTYTANIADTFTPSLPIITVIATDADPEVLYPVAQMLL